jgi:hypothetical protein
VTRLVDEAWAAMLDVLGGAEGATAMAADRCDRPYRTTQAPD